MKIKNILIVVLLIAGVSLYGYFRLVVIPQNNEKHKNYILMQQNPETHDFESVMKYKHLYMGNASNLSNLFNNLPLKEIDKTFQLFPENLTAQIEYKEISSNIDNNHLLKSLIYNSLSAYILINNLEKLIFVFEDTTYITKKNVFKNFFGDFSELLKIDIWKNNFQEPLKNDDYVNEISKTLIIEI